MKPPLHQRRLNLQVVQWLHDSGVCPASLAVLDDVAAGGQLDALVWLHEHGAGAGETAVNRAAEGGHADVVAYLLKSRQEVGGPSDSAAALLYFRCQS